MADPTDDPAEGWSWTDLAGSRPPAAVGPGAPAAPPAERYEPGAELGRGGTGRVVAVLDTWLGRTVARKELRDGAVAARLMREARVTAGLEHPGIVPVYDAGFAADGRPWYTMRVAAGRTLADAIAEADGPGRLRLVRRLLAACEAVSYAHSRGVVHRDLKPANILVGRHGETQVADWGLAVRLSEPAEAGEGVVGTPAWMSPEQARGEPPDPRADVWSLGAILLCLLGGRPPFAGESSEVVLARLRGGRPPDFAVEGAPPELVAVARVALAPAARDRYADAGALAEELARWLDGRRVEAHVYTTGELVGRLVSRWRVPLAVAAVALVSLTTVGVVAWVRTERERARAVEAEGAASAALARSDAHLSQALLSQGRAALHVGAMPEAAVLGAHALALGQDPEEARGLLAGALAAPRATLEDRADTPGCSRVALSEAGARLVCAEADGLSGWDTHPLTRRWRVDGAADRVEVRGGTVIAVIGGSLRVLDAADGHTRAEGAPVPASWVLDLAPDGTRAWAVATTAPILTIDLATGQVDSSWPCGPSGTLLHASVPGHEAAACDDGRLLFDGELHPTLLGKGRGKPAAMVLSPDGATLVAGTYQGELVVLDPRTGALRGMVVVDASAVRDLAYSPDGSLLAVLTERGGVSVWRPETGARVVQLPRVDVQRVRWAGPVALETVGRHVARWRLPAAPAPWLFARDDGVSALALSPDGARVASAHGDGAAAVWDLATGAQRLLRWQGRVVKDVAFLGAEVVAVGMGAPHPHRFDAAGGAPLGVWAMPDDQRWRRIEPLGPGGLLGVSFDPRGPFVWSDPATTPVDAGLGEGWDAAADPDDGSVLVAGAGGVVRVRPGPVVEPVDPDPDVRAVDAGPGGRMALVREAGIDVGRPGAYRRMAAVDDALLDVAFSPDGARVAAAGMSGVVWLWDVATGERVAMLRGHEGRVAAVEFSADGRTLYSGAWDGRVRRWDLAAAASVADLERDLGLGLPDLAGADFR